MSQTKGKKLLILGGSSASYDLVKVAKEMGIYTIVTDYYPSGVAKDISDENATISTTDIDALCRFVKEKQIDGVFSGPSEFNIQNVIRVCEQANKPCYTTMELWDKCGKKDLFKKYCRQYGVDCTPEYAIDLNTPMEELLHIDYPIIIKPVDGNSSMGITVCQKAEEVPAAIEKAYAASTIKRIIAEKYIENSGELFSVRYVLKNGEAYPYFVMDTYVADPIHRTSLISGFTYAPSKYVDYYMEHMDMNVRKMLSGMGLKNGVAFFQALPYRGKIYFHEMGYRLSGGMMFKLTAPLANLHDMRIMLQYAVGAELITDEELERIDISCGGRIGAQLMVPLNTGTISTIEGVEEIKAHPSVIDYLQYYQVGDTVEERAIGTLAQHFARITFVVGHKNEAIDAITYFQEKLKIYDDRGRRMNELQFDVNRLDMFNN